jgi:hypothetical protein
MHVRAYSKPVDHGPANGVCMYEDAIVSHCEYWCGNGVKRAIE